MTNESNVIHVKLNYEEVITSKKDILASEMDIINIMKSLGRYVFLRQKELELRAQFFKEIKKISMNLKLLESVLPHVKVPKILTIPSERPIAKPVQRKNLNSNEDGLEEQLREIQRKLRSIY